MAIVLTSRQSFHAPPANVDLLLGNRQIYYRSNMEFVTGILGTTNGGTGNASFKDDEVIIYSGGKFISSGISKEELDALKGVTSDGETTITQLLNSKVSGIFTAQNVQLDKNSDNNVTLPDYLLKTGGTVTGNLTVNKKLRVGNVEMAYDSNTDSVSFTVV